MLSMRFLATMAIVLAATAGSSFAQNQPGRKPDALADLLAKLRKPIDLQRIDNVSAADLAALLGEKAGVTIFLDEAAFKAIEPAANPAAQELKIPALRGISLTTALPLILKQMDATYLVCKDHIDIVPVAHAARETKNMAAQEDDGPVRLAQPLVSMIFKEKPLNEALAELAEEYNLTVVVSPQSGDARTGFVSARLLNTPADKAIELLALQCELRVVRKANTFLVTTRDQSDGLFQEKMDRERARAELDKFRTAPLTPPQPQPPQPQPQPQPPQPVPNPVPPPKQP